MKFHLPKKLLVAVLAAVSVSSAYRANAAATLSTPVYVHTVETEELLKVLPPELAAGVIDGNYVKPYVKAGGGTLVIEGITDGGNYATTKTPVYTREGTTIIKDSKIMYAPWKDGASTVLQVAGKNAEMVLDNSQMINSDGSDGDPRVNGAYLAVGGPDGKGVLTLKNNSRLTCSYSLIAGYHKEGNWYGYHIPTSTTNTIDPTSGRFAEGEYKYDESSGLYYGEAVVNVLSGSQLALGSALLAAETTINVDGVGSVFSDGFVYGAGAASYLGRQNGSTTRINITNGGKFKSSGWLITSDYLGVKDAAVHIGVDGSGSELKAKYLFMGFGQKNGADIGSCCESTLAVKNGATVNVSESYLGEFNENSGDSKALVTVDSSSSFNAQDGIYVSKGATIDNSGIIAAPIIEITNGTLIVQGADAKVETGSLTLSGGSVANTGALSVDSDFCVYAGSVSNSGSIVVDSFKVSGEGSCFSFDSNSSLTADRTRITDSASVNYTYFGETSETGAPITISAIENGYNEFDMDEETNFNLELSGEYLSTLEGTEVSLLVKVASGNLDNCDLNNTFTVSLDNSVIWSAAGLEWSAKDDGLYIVGTLTRNQEVIVDESGEVTGNITDTDKDVSLIITGDAIISGNNTHTGGTDVKDAAVVLGSASALGNGEVLTQGNASLSTSNGVTAMLPGAITNSGNLTMNGSYDGSKLSEIVTADTRVCVDGKDGNNGFFRKGGTALVVVDNKGNATLTVDGNTVVLKGDQSLKLDASGLATEKGLDYSNYRIEDAGHEASMSEIQAMRPDQDAALTISMNGGTLVADTDATDVKATAGTIETKGDVAVGGKLTGATSVVVGEGITTLSGDNSYMGYTSISGENSKLIVGSDKALGASKVQLRNKGKLDLNGKAVGNYINVTGCELHNASAYTGSMDVSGNLTICGSNATADVVNMVKGGSIAASANESLTVNAVTVSGGDSTIDADLVINPDGSVVLNNGSKLNVKRSLTLGNGTTIVLNGGNYSKDDVILTSADTTAPAGGEVTLSYGRGTYVLNGNDIILTAVFNQNYADALTVSNWGIATASRAVVNAVRGQRSNTGCIADGKGTAWVAILGGNNDINGSDISLSGAALGADMKVGAASRVGIALGYVEGEVRPSGLRQVDQEGSYIAAYGEHGLKKLSSTSCLSMDWVAAYGVTESEGAGQKWEQDSVQLNSRVNWNKKVTDKLCMSVFGGLEYFANNSDTVDGVKTGSIQNLRGEIGVGARYVAWGAPAATASYDEKGAMLAEARPGCEKLVLNGEIRYMNDMVRSNPVIRMEGLSGMGENPGRQGMGIEAGATYRIGERWSASANYGFNTMEDSKEHRVNVGAAYTF